MKNNHQKMNHRAFLVLCFLMMLACNHTDESIPQIPSSTILHQLLNNYSLLPEEAITVNSDSTVFAQYTKPTEKYTHGILGDRIEAEQLIVVVDGQFYEHSLPDDFVFEDIRPRLYDVDQDGQLEFITIRTEVSRGAGIAIFKIINGQLLEYAHVEEIGLPSRWLNIITVDDLDQDGINEIAWIQTPHIGGILKVAKINPGVLQVLAEQQQYSNHAIGDRNLCLSVLTQQANEKVVYVPNQTGTNITGFTFSNNEWSIQEVIDQAVDFSEPLNGQYTFDNVIEDKVNCIDPG
ncbi:MAG: hypothetical protein AAF598_12645 [Bacteroidota bacterium]